MSPILWVSTVISVISIAIAAIAVINILSIRRSTKRIHDAQTRESQALDNISRELDNLIKKGR
ncbi:hypothetical protein TCA2_4498 [Paenibacillus sp. TCA20]|nr:hypothetical protein TCA2_4498 [Paenibacillus sp. TCA20]